MRFTPLTLPGAYLLDIEPLHDERGFFARTFCREEFLAHGLSPELVQCSVSYNLRRGTLRGMHYQAEPDAEAKLVRCTRGAIYDVLLDLRPASPTYLQWTAVELTAANRRMVYIPDGLAHGFQTLEDDTEVFYQMSHPYVPGAARGVRWDDPAFAIHWPPAERIISPKDLTYPDFTP